MNVSDVRRRLQRTIAEAKGHEAERRAVRDRVSRAYDRLLDGVAIPVFRLVHTALKAEGHPFDLVTPPGVVRLTSLGSPTTFIELALDEDADVPIVLVRSSVRRGRQTAGIERPLRRDNDVASITREEVLEAVLAEIGPLIV